jgi:F-type H+-transporting ATPase subunit delta
MASTRAALLCKSNLDLANSKGVAEVVNNDMKTIASTINGNLELSTLFKIQLLKSKKEQALLEVLQVSMA